MIIVLIVDDEPTIVEGMSQMIQELDEENLIVLKAYSGSHALKIMQSTNVNIVLCDICMPGMTGVQVMEEVEKLWPRCKMLFLTGYNSFEYIHKVANSSMFCGYFIKNDGDDELIKALERIFEEIRQGDEKELLLKNVQEQISTLSPMITNAYLQSIAYGDDIKIPEGMDLHINPSSRLLTVMSRLIGVESYPEALKAAELCKEAIRFHSDCQIPLEYAVLHSGSLLWLCENNKWSDESFIQHISAILKVVQAFLQEKYEIGADFAIAWRTDTLDNVHKCVPTLQGMLDSIGSNAEGMMILDKDWVTNFPFLQSAGSDYSFAQSLEAMESALSLAQLESFLHHFSELCSIVPPHELKVKHRINILQVMLNSAHRLNVYSDMADNLSNDLLSLQLSEEKWVDRIRQLGEHICEVSLRSTEQNTQKMIGAINTFISKNISNRDLSLVMLGEMSGFNPTYLSRYYKQQTGVNIWDYISSLRLESACGLLKKGDIPVHDVGLQIGFDSSSYFSGFFRRKMGMSPKQYQEMVRKGELQTN